MRGGDGLVWEVVFAVRVVGGSLGGWGLHYGGLVEMLG